MPVAEDKIRRNVTFEKIVYKDLETYLETYNKSNKSKITKSEFINNLVREKITHDK